MRESNVRIWLVSLVVLSLVLGSVVSGAVAAQAAPAASYPQLVNGVAATGSIVGSRAGAFAYYTISYLGDRSVVTIELEFAPADPVIRLGFGFNVYGPDGYFIGEGAAAESESHEPMQLQYSDNNLATWLVQVYNYIPGLQVQYSLLATGLPSPSQPASISTPTVAPAPPEEARLDTLVSGQLVGKGAGAYGFYDLPYVGNGPEVKLTLRFSPDDPVIAQGVGLILYGPSGELARGQPTGQPGERRVAWSGAESALLLIQVYNYIEGVPITYTVTKY